MENELAILSNQLAGIVERAAPSVVAVHAHSRFSSSGVFWKPGVIVTAEHTIRREEEITITLPDGSSDSATLAGSDPGTDLAVLRTEHSGPVPPVISQGPAPGHLVLAIGRSQDSGVNATMGIVSAVGPAWRTWRGGRLDSYIRLGLMLYPGSAGGLVVNTAGEAVGIATSVLSRIAGVAIPATTVSRVTGEILARGRVRRGYLGVGLQPVELPGHHKGVIVLSLEENGPAARAGVLIGDVLLSFGAHSVADTDDVQSALETCGVGDKIEARLVRGGAAHTVEVTIGERPGRE